MNAIQASIIYVLGEGIAKLMPFLLLPYLSRKLGVEGFGALSYYQTFIALFFLVINLSQDGAISRYFYFYGKRALPLIVSTGYGWSIMVSSILFCLCLCFKADILAYCVLAALFQALVSVQLGIRQCQKNAIAYASIQLMISISSVFFTVLLLELFEYYLIEKRILALVFSYLFTFFIAHVFYQKGFTIRRFSFGQYKRACLYLFSVGFPLILHHLSYFFKGQLDRILVYHQFSEAELGIYAMGAQLAMILMVLLQALNKATVPYYFDALKNKRITLKQVHRLAGFALCLVPIPVLLLWWIPEYVLLWLLGDHFVGVKYYMGLFLIANALMIPYFILVNYLFYYGKNKAIAYSSLLSTVAYLLALWGVIHIGINYVPFASILGTGILLPLLFLMTHRVSKQS